MPALAATRANGLDALIESASAASSARELFAITSKRLRGLVPFDAAAWMATDPATNLPTAPAYGVNMEHVCTGSESCLRFWEFEFFAEDFNLFRDLTRAPSPAAGLRMATGGRPGKSTRFRGFVEPHGFDDELRAVLRVDGDAWASICLFREPGRDPFDPSDADFLGRISQPLGASLRELARPAKAGAPKAQPRGPGMMVFSPDGELVSANDDALAWLEELEAQPGRPQNLGVGLPVVFAGTLIRARAAAAQGDRHSVRARVRSPANGRWLVCHASCLRDPDGALGNTALVIEPANSSEIAPIVARAYELTARERQITRLVCHGASTAQMAERLFLSRHTVRGHLKAIFEKVGVSSRGELVAKLFAEQYGPVHLAPEDADSVNDPA
jgi:DNA-binding CsgD family transcriptional regulator